MTLNGLLSGTACRCCLLPGNEPSSTTDRHLLVSAVPHHFNISVDLQRIANLTFTHPVTIFVR